MRSRPSRLSRLLLGCVIAVMSSLAADAHDGGFGHSRRTLFIGATDQAYELEYRIHQEPAEAIVEMTHMDADRDGKVSAAERDAYLSKHAAEIAAQFIARDSAGKRLQLVPAGQSLDHSRVQRYRFTIATTESPLVLEDRNFPHKPGVVQLKLAAGVTAELAEPTDLSHADRVPLVVRRTP